MNGGAIASLVTCAPGPKEEVISCHFSFLYNVSLEEVAIEKCQSGLLPMVHLRNRFSGAGEEKKGE